METKEATPGEAQWAQYSVLVVDDEPGMLSFLQRALASRPMGSRSAAEHCVGPSYVDMHYIGDNVVRPVALTSSTDDANGVALG